MSWVQRLITGIVPRRWAESMEADSRSWIVRCRCGFEQSVWDMGGIRWKAAGRPRWLLRCRDCGKRTWHTVEKKPPAGPSTAPMA